MLFDSDEIVVCVRIPVDSEIIELILGTLMKGSGQHFVCSIPRMGSINGRALMSLAGSWKRFGREGAPDIEYPHSKSNDADLSENVVEIEIAIEWSACKLSMKPHCSLSLTLPLRTKKAIIAGLVASIIE